MASKSGPVPTDSRKKVVCDYCDKEFERINLKDHTARMHGKVAVKEKLIGNIQVGVKNFSIFSQIVEEVVMKPLISPREQMHV